MSGKKIYDRSFILNCLSLYVKSTVIMKDFFKVTGLDRVLKYVSDFTPVETEEVALPESVGRVLADDVASDIDLPGFSRSTMDGYAVRAASTFGATEGNPAYLNIKGTVSMGESPTFSIGSEEAAKISTGGMLPEGADSVVMVEHTEAIDDTTIEVYKAVAPGQHIIEKGEDFNKGSVILSSGCKLRPQEVGLLAAFGHKQVKVFKKPVIGIISTGDEVVPVDVQPDSGQIRDINTYSLSGLVKNAGGEPISFGIIKDDFDALLDICTKAFETTDMVLISGGSSVGTRDFTIDVLNALPDAKILVHGISISPGKPTILSKVKNKPVWGLPGQVVSAMVVFEIVVKPFIEYLSGVPVLEEKSSKISAILTRNISSAQGRIDYIRVRLHQKEKVLLADPILGKSGLINTMIEADGLVEIGINTEGLDKGSEVWIIPLS